MLNIVLTFSKSACNRIKILWENSQKWRIGEFAQDGLVRTAHLHLDDVIALLQFVSIPIRERTRCRDILLRGREDLQNRYLRKKNVQLKEHFTQQLI